MAVTLIVVCESPQRRHDGHAMNVRYLRPPQLEASFTYRLVGNEQGQNQGL
jgi:hypothetical protein